MKNYVNAALVLILLAFAASGCSQKLSEIQAEYLAMLESPASPQSILSIGAYLDKNLKAFDTGHADQMVMAYEDYIFMYDSEGPDYKEFTDRYRKRISEPLSGLYEIKLYEKENPMVTGDAALLCSWKQLGIRALNLEVFIKENKNHMLVREEAARIYEYYVKAMLSGTKGTPVFEQASGKFKEDALVAYAEIVASFPDTTVASALVEYLEYLANVDFALDYGNAEENTVFSDVCAHLASEAGKRVLL